MKKKNKLFDFFALYIFKRSSVIRFFSSDSSSSCSSSPNKSKSSSFFFSAGFATGVWAGAGLVT